jgi:hypothetical protein
VATDKVKRSNGQKGYGLIQPDGGKDVFVQNSVEYDRSVCALGFGYFPWVELRRSWSGLLSPFRWSAGYRFNGTLRRSLGRSAMSWFAMPDIS